MNRIAFENYITETFSTTGEQLFAKYPGFRVFRHLGNRKWFAVIMDIPRKNLGLPGDNEISVVNLKCDPILIGSFREDPGIFPAWHMNKSHWLSVALDGTATDESLLFLLGMSYELTKNEEVGKPLPHFFSNYSTLCFGNVFSKTTAYATVRTHRTPS